MYTQNVSIPPDYFAWRSALSSPLDNEPNGREGNIQNMEEAGKYSNYY